MLIFMPHNHPSWMAFFIIRGGFTNENYLFSTVHAVAGTGKSTCLIARKVLINDQYPKAKVLMISFTKKSAMDLRERIGSTSNVTVSTFHSLVMALACSLRISKILPLTFPIDKSRGFLVRQPLHSDLSLSVLHDFPKR